jgi:hypothetical protein
VLEPRRLLRRLHTEPVHERAAALEELTQRPAPLPGPRVREHQATVVGLVQPIGLKQLARPDAGTDEITAREVAVSETGDHSRVQIAQPLAPAERP